MKVLFNYAHRKFYTAQKVQSETGYKVGGFDRVYQYGLKDIDSAYYQQNKHILDNPIGAGFWIWKYYFAKRLLDDNTIPENSYIFYADSGSLFLDSIDHLISVMERDGGSIMTFRQNHLSYVFTKRDMFILMDADEPKYTHTGQRCGGWFLFRKNDESKEFINQCYNYSLDYRIITECANELGVPDYEGFIGHRHDESLITIVSKKWNLYPYRQPCQYGYLSDVDYTNNRYDEIGFKEMIEKFGPISTWKQKTGVYFHGESLSQYPEIIIDDKSTYPTILNLHKMSF